MAAQLGSTYHLAKPLAWHYPRSQPRPHRAVHGVCAAGDHGVYLLDYGAGNVRSVRNACKVLGCELNEVSMCRCLRIVTEEAICMHTLKGVCRVTQQHAVLLCVHCPIV